MRRYLSLLLFFIITLLVSSQERLTELIVEPVLSNASVNNPVSLKSSQGDTLTLPFIDDFSNLTIYPNPEKWRNKSVFINASYAVSPPTIGVATFDAFDSNGIMHNNADVVPFPADVLISNPINLKEFKYYIAVNNNFVKKIRYTDLFHKKNNTYFQANDFLTYDSLYRIADESSFFDTLALYYINNSNDTVAFHDTLYYFMTDSNKYKVVERKNIYRDYLSPADSVYFSFFYQPQGLADNPEKQDTLIVEFLHHDSIWEPVAKLYGDSLRPFRIKMIPIRDDKFFTNNFAVRFRNYASITFSKEVPEKRSNVDHWNIDYVLLDWDRTQADSFFKDVAVVEPLKSLLADYQAIPWTHYSSASSSQAVDELSYTYRNLLNQTNYAHRYLKIENKTLNTSQVNSLGRLDPSANELYTNTTDFFYNFLDDPVTGDSALFNISFYLNTDIDIIKENDTVTFEQKFYNYYAYDDGTSEAGWGIQGEGTQSAKIAYRFKSFETDTLRSIMIFFNQSYESSNVDTSNPYRPSYFFPTVWSNNQGVPGNVIYQEKDDDGSASDDNFQRYYGLNTFIRYDLKNPIQIKENEFFYVGLEQTKDKYLNIGYDRNNNSNENLFFNINGNWIQSSLNGALMIRVAMGDKLPAGEKEIAFSEELDIRTYPNPVRDYLYIEFSEEVAMHTYTLEIYSLEGQLIMQQPVNGWAIDLQFLDKGIYILRLQDNLGNLYTTKLIRQ